MSVSQTRAAQRRIKLRYKGPNQRSVAESIEHEKQKAVRASAVKGKK